MQWSILTEQNKMRLFGYWTVFVALCISVVAAYYSIVGLVAIFASAVVPVIIMGAALEVGKLTTAVWLHLNWTRAGFLIKSYLVFATMLLMFITSMGIFGFLSKAHIEQTAVATEGVAQLERLQTEISRNENIISRAETTIQKLNNSSTVVDNTLQIKIEAEQQRITSANNRIELTVTDLKESLSASIVPWQQEFDVASSDLIKLSELTAIDTRDRDRVRTLQAFVKAKPDGAWGSKTAQAVEDYKVNLENKKQVSLSQIQQLRDKASTEIARVRAIAEREIADSNQLVARLRSQLGRGNAITVEADVEEQNIKIRKANISIGTLMEKKYEIESQARVLEAEVGPVKYIAEMVYGTDAGTSSLEQAVRAVILILVFVFDPLAVALVISGISLVEQNQKTRKRKEEPVIEHKPVVKVSEPEPEKVQPKKKVNSIKKKIVKEKQPVIVDVVQENLYTDKIVYKGVTYEPGNPEYATIKDLIDNN